MTFKKFTLATPVEELPLVGRAYVYRLKKLGIENIQDILQHYPHRYEDFSLISAIAQVQSGEMVTIQGEISTMNNVFTRGGKQIQKAIITDHSGWIEVVWFNQPYLVKAFPPGAKIALAGKIQPFLGKLSLVSPEFEMIKPGEQLHTGRLVPIYPETANLSSKWLRAKIAFALKAAGNQIQDWLPEKFRKKYGLMNLNLALRQIHFPANKQMAQEAKYHLSFEELLLLHLQSIDRKTKWQTKKVKEPLKIDRKKINQFIAKLPFKLTAAQQRTIQEILDDLTKATPANRLLQGDVGSGKTVVAAIACYAAFLDGQKSAFMVPTAILAEQHYKTIKQLLQPFKVKIAPITSDKKNKIDLKKTDIFLGTHALLYRRLDFEKIALVVIDEQHRFGVEQRSALINQSSSPHLLTMTATPIPRTVALTLYGDLDLSLIKESPHGRKTIKTWVIPQEKREAAYAWIDKQIAKEKSQAFIVCPLIEESEHESMANVKAATQEFAKLEKIFPKRRLALLHGKVKPKERQLIMKGFNKGKIDILVSTPVVEVGIDIPNATIILIEAAERFGLAQLHQLRGRVGRNKKQSYCLLFSQAENPENLKRLKAMEQFSSGLKLAEIDLALRGPGEIYGLRQSGFINLKIATFADTELIAKTKSAALELYREKDTFPVLQEKIKKITIPNVIPN